MLNLLLPVIAPPILPGAWRRNHGQRETTFSMEMIRMKQLAGNRIISIPPRLRAAIYYALSFFIPLLVMTLALLALHVTPFGEHDLAVSDAAFYLNGEMFFSRLLKGQENILYSFNNGLGGNEWSLFAWGGFGFGNLLSLFATLETIPSVFTWICAVNLALCGLTMYVLMAYVNGHHFGSLIFSTSYAFIGFNVANVYQTGFFLGPQTLPLLILGLLLLFRGRNPLLYILSLAFCTFFSFYFAFHLCVISLILFVGYSCVHREEWAGKRKGLFLRWFASSVIGGLLAAPVWLPTLKAYSGGGRLDQTVLAEYSFRENMPFLQIFSKLFTGANSTSELVNGLPNIFCGVLVLALVILYFLDKRVELRYKRAAAVVLVVYLISFYIPAFTLLMHGGTHTNWFPYRYSYVFSFLLICLASEEFRRIGELTIRDTKRCGVILLAAVLLIFSTSYEFISGGMVLLDLALLLFMWLGFWYFKTKPDKAPLRTLSMLLLILVCINLYSNFILSTKSVQEWELNLEDYRENIMTSGALIDALNQAEPDFFRMEKDVSESSSIGVDSYLYNYNGVSHSGPAERMFIHRQLNRLGINWFDMRHWYSEGVPAAADTLLGLKYLISQRDLAEEKGYEKRITMEDTSIYQNEHALSPAILANGAVQEPELGSNAFANLNEVWKAMTGETRDIFTMQEDVTYQLVNDYSNQTVTSRELRESASASASRQEEKTEDPEEPASYILYRFTAAQDGPVYLFDTSIPDSGYGLAAPAIKYVGTYRAGETVEGKFPLDSGIGSGDMMRGYCANIVFAYADNSVLQDCAEQLNSRDVTFNVVRENDLTGSFTAEEGQRLLFTFPWDEGWTCTIDGQEVPIDKTWDLFMSVEAPAGSHTYEMKFFPAWMEYGLILAGAALAGLAALMIVWTRKRTDKQAAPAETSAEQPVNEERIENEMDGELQRYLNP